MTLDETTYSPGAGAMGFDHPISWVQEYQGGRSFYTGLGAHGGIVLRTAVPAAPVGRHRVGGGRGAGRRRGDARPQLPKGCPRRQHAQPDGDGYRRRRPRVLRRARRRGEDVQPATPPRRPSATFLCTREAKTVCWGLRSIPTSRRTSGFTCSIRRRARASSTCRGSRSSIIKSACRRSGSCCESRCSGPTATTPPAQWTLAPTAISI